MKRLLIFLTLLALLVPLLLSAPIVQATTYDSTPYGVTIQSKTAGIQTDTSTQNMVKTGMKWVRQQPHWNKEETSPGVFDWSLADSEMALSVKYGLKVDWALQSPPTWDIQPGCTLVSQAQPMAEYAVKVFHRYGSEISSFEVGNEEWSFDQNLSCRTPQNYAPVYNTVTLALRNAGYTGLLGMFGYTHYSSTAQISSWFNTFSKLVAFDRMDYGNFHFYHDGDPNVANSKPALMQVVGAIHNAFSYAGHSYKPLWVTEYGWATNCTGCVTPTQQAAYEREVLNDGRTSGGELDHAFVYTLCASCPSPFSIYQSGMALPAAIMEASYSQRYPNWPQL